MRPQNPSHRVIAQFGDDTMADRRTLLLVGCLAADSSTVES